MSPLFDNKAGQTWLQKYIGEFVTTTAANFNRLALF